MPLHLLLERKELKKIARCFLCILNGELANTKISAENLFSLPICDNGVSKKAFLREEGGTRSVTEGARVTLGL